MVCPVVTYGCESWTVKKAEHRRIDAFELWCWRRLLRVPQTARRSNQSVLKEINPEYSLDAEAKAPILWPPDGNSQLIGKASDAGKYWGQEEKGVTEDEMAGWHHQLNGHESEQTPEDSEGQESLACCSPWGCKELDTTVRLNNNSVSCLIDNETPTRWKKLTTWWPDCSNDIDGHNSENWPQRNGNKPILELKINCT